MTHYYNEKQTSGFKLRKLNVSLRDYNLELFVSGGVFSSKRLDKGTEVLIKNMIIKKDWNVLDLGCGYGAIGLFVAKIAKNVYLIDINERAVKLAKMNAGLNKIKVKILQGNMYETVEDMKFDTILINPPQTAGKDVCFEMIEKAREHLKKDGLLQVVARHNKGGKQLAKKMEETFNNVGVIVKEAGYRVYVSKQKV